MTPPSEAEDTESVQAFFDHWSVYKKAVDANYIHHREAMAALHSALAARHPVGNLLDIGCGDAASIPALLDGLDVTSYTGLDVSPVALDLARANLAGQAFATHLIHGDFAEELPHLHDVYDVIVASLSMHHLPTARKPEFFASACRRLTPGGLLLVYEPSMRPGESRAQYVERQGTFFETFFTEMPVADRDELNRHVRDDDFPETPGGYAQLALDTGFASARLLYVDPQHFWAALAFTR